MNEIAKKRLDPDHGRVTECGGCGGLFKATATRITTSPLPDGVFGAREACSADCPDCGRTATWTRRTARQTH
jgi:hypothetical protein